MPWIKSPAWDLVWILNALWLGPLVLLLAHGYDSARESPVDGLFFAIAVPLWFGHRVSSAWLAYATPAYRPLLTTQRLRFVLAPLAIAIACFAFLLVPEETLSIPLTERVLALAILDYLLVSHHFAAQHFGLLSLYRSRAQRASEPDTRRLDRWFALVVGGGLVVLAEALAGSIAFQDRWITPLLGPNGAATLAHTLRVGGVLFVGALTVLMLAVELRSRRPSAPRAAYVLGMSATVLLAYLARDPFLFIVLWSVQHWSAAMGLSSLVAAGGAPAQPGRWQTLVDPINRRSWAVVLVLCVAGTLLLPVLEVEAVSDEYAYADRIFGEGARWLRSSPLVPLLLALGFASGFIHYLLDRATFRFSSPEVRNAARGLLQPLAVCVLAILPFAGHAQSIEPRAYSNAPVGVNFLIAGYAQTRGGLAFDTSIPITDVSLRTNNGVLGYARTLDLWGKSGKFDMIVQYAALSGSADFAGAPITRDIHGIGDPAFRISMNFIGAPALDMSEFASYKQDAIFGGSLQVSAPWGQYDSARVVNLGSNRWSFRPELGLSKTQGPWTLEFKAAATIFTDNKDFYGGKTRSVDPIYSVSGHAIYNMRSGSWWSVDGTYFAGGRSTLNGVLGADLQQNWRAGATLAIPVDRHSSVKLYASRGLSARTGNNFDLLGIAWQYRWGGGL
jgi:hypothetical protein